MPRPARPDDLYRLAVPYDPRLSPDGSRVVFSVKRTSVGKDGYRQSHLDRPDRRQRARAPADAGHADGPLAADLAGRIDARVHQRPPAVCGGGARPAEGGQGPRRLLPGPPAAARRRRGAPPDRPAEGRHRARVVAGWLDARRPQLVARRDRGRGPPQARPPRQAEARRDAALRLPVHRPAGLPVQRRGLHRRQGPAPVARRRRDRRGAAARRRADARG